MSTNRLVINNTDEQMNSKNKKNINKKKHNKWPAKIEYNTINN